MIKPIEWSAELEPYEKVRYNHVTASTPFGDFLITWKGWKSFDSFVVEETPWGDWYEPFFSLEEAKIECELLFQQKLKSCLI